jgi:prolyl 4-hydroxylase
MPLADLEARASAGEASAQVRLADQLALEGRHYEALEWLARAAKTGDAEAMRVLGLKLVTGIDAPSRPKDGVSLLADAAARGDGQAASVLAVLAGGGFHAPQSWPVALDCLQRAAELGFGPARDQLRLLAPPAAAVAAAADRAHFWRRLREGVDVQAWGQAPPARVAHDVPRVMTVQQLLPAAICDWIIGQSKGRLVRAEVTDPKTGRTIMGSTRTNRVANFGLGETSLLNLLIQTRIASVIGAPLAMMEAFAVLNYRPGEEASEHHDYLDPAVPAYAADIARLGQRVATALVYLNDDYEGGETDFPELGIKHRGRRGDVLIFLSVAPSGAPDPRTLHAGRPPTRGEKWVLSQFIRNKPLVGAGS